MTELASLYAILKADVSNLQAGLKTAQAEIAKTAQGVKTMGAQTAASAGQVNNSVNTASQGISRMGRDVAGATASALGLQLGVAGATAAVVKFGASSVRAAMDFEQTEIAFTSMLGSGTRAKAFLDDLRDFAAHTPFEFTGLTEASRRLMAFGFEAQQVIPMLTNIGDAVAAMGGGAAMIDRVTLAFGQMSAKGKVSAQEMLQLTEAGIPAWQYLADAMGLSTAEVMKLVERGLVPAEAAIADIQAGMQGDFGGMMADQMDTAAGAASNFNDALTTLKTNAGELAINAGLTDFIKGLTGRVEAANAVFEAFEAGALNVVEAVGLLISLGGMGFDPSQELAAAEAAMDELMATTLETSKAQGDAALVIQDLTARYGLLTAAKLQDMYISGELTEAEMNTILAAMLHGEHLEQLIARFTNGQPAADAWTARLQGMADRYASMTPVIIENMNAADAWADRLQGQADALGVATEANYDWVTSAERAAAAQAEANQLLMQAVDAGMSGAISTAWDEYNTTIAETQAGLAELSAEINRYQSMNGLTVTVTHEATRSMAEAKLAAIGQIEAYERLQTAQSNLNDNTDPEKQFTLNKSVLEAQVAFENASERAQQYGASLGSSETFITNYDSKLTELRGEIDEHNAAQVRARQALHETTAAFIMQQIAGNLTADGYLLMARNLGLIDEASYNLATALQELTVKYDINKDEAIDASEATHGYWLEVARLKGEVDGMQTTKDFWLRFHYTYDGMMPDQVLSDAMSNPGGAPIPMAHGGSGVVTSPTLFLAGEAGMPEAFQFTPMSGGDYGGGGGGGGDWGIQVHGDLVVNVNGAGDPREAAAAVIEAMQDRGLISKSLRR